MPLGASFASVGSRLPLTVDVFFLCVAVAADEGTSAGLLLVLGELGSKTGDSLPWLSGVVGTSSLLMSPLSLSKPSILFESGDRNWK